MTRPMCVLVDVDGTLCDVSSVRWHVDPSDPRFSGQRRFDRFHAASVDCPANPLATTIVARTHAAGVDVVVVTARKWKWRYHTIVWLDEHGVDYHDLYMRDDGDNRADVEVKADMLARIRRRWTPILAVDDNPSVCRLWLSEGIGVLRVPGWEGS